MNSELISKNKRIDKIKIILIWICSILSIIPTIIFITEISRYIESMLLYSLFLIIGCIIIIVSFIPLIIMTRVIWRYNGRYKNVWKM